MWHQHRGHPDTQHISDFMLTLIRLDLTSSAERHAVYDLAYARIDIWERGLTGKYRWYGSGK